MAAPSAVTQVTQIGVEAPGSPGTPVAAGKKLRSMSFTPDPQLENNLFRPEGSKYATVATPGRDWTRWATPGQPTYDELMYPLSSILGAPVVTTPVGGTDSRQWVWSPSSTNPDTRQTYTIEKGNATQARRTAYSIWTDYSLNITRDQVEQGGSVMAQNIEEGVSLTASPTQNPDVPLAGSQFTIYSDTTFAGIGTTELQYPFRAEWSLSDVVNGVWPIRRSLPSYGEHVETVPTPRLELTPAADAVGTGFIAALRAGSTRYIRLEAVGPVIEAAITYRLTIDLALKVINPGAYSDEDGVFVLPFTFGMVDDADFGRAQQVTLVCKQAAL